MLEFIQASIAGFPAFIIHFVAGVGLAALFIFTYVHVTPYSEISLIRQGNTAAAASLSGSLLGFTIPLAHAIAQSHNVVDMLIWGSIALVVQIVTYLLVRLLLPGLAKDIPEGKTAQGIFLGVVSVAAGLINAACMTE